MAKGQSLQDPFLNALRKEKVPVSIYLVNGIKLQGQIDSFDQFVIWFSIALGYEDVGCSFQVSDGFSQCSTGQKAFRPKRLPAIHQNNIESVFEAKVLESVIKK